MRAGLGNLVLFGVIFLVVAVTSEENRPDDTIDILNRCLQSENHKRKPSKEDELLTGHCAPWSNRSCCTIDTANLIHYGTLYNFRVEHCGNNTIKPKCLERMQQNHCFYECSPNLGPWLVPVNMKIRNETFRDVPLCKTDCDAWWEDCKDSMTCIDNWTKFDWGKVDKLKGKWNVCPVGKPCKSFQEIWGDAKNFCEKIWDNSFKYTPNEEPCMRMWFDQKGGNPNDFVAAHRINFLNGANGTVSSVRRLTASAVCIVGFSVLARLFH